MFDRLSTTGRNDLPCTYQHLMVFTKPFYFSDLSFPRLGQMIMDYDPPLKKLSEEFVPHAKLLYSALISLWPIYHSHNLSADKWR